MTYLRRVVEKRCGLIQPIAAIVARYLHDKDARDVAARVWQRLSACHQPPPPTPDDGPRRHVDRYAALRQACATRKVPMRDDSHLCRAYLDGTLPADTTADAVADKMLLMCFLFARTDYRALTRRLRSPWKTSYEVERRARQAAIEDTQRECLASYIRQTDLDVISCEYRIRYECERT